MFDVTNNGNEDDTLMTERLLPVFNEQSVMGMNMCQRLLLEGLGSSLNQGFKYAGRLNFVGWSIILLGPQNRKFLTSPFLYLKF